MLCRLPGDRQAGACHHVLGVQPRRRQFLFHHVPEIANQGQPQPPDTVQVGVAQVRQLAGAVQPAPLETPAVEGLVATEVAEVGAALEGQLPLRQDRPLALLTLQAEIVAHGPVRITDWHLPFAGHQ